MPVATMWAISYMPSEDQEKVLWRMYQHRLLAHIDQWIGEMELAVRYNEIIGIGKNLILSPSFPLLRTVQATFTAYGVPSMFTNLY